MINLYFVEVKVIIPLNHAEIHGLHPRTQEIESRLISWNRIGSIWPYHGKMRNPEILWQDYFLIILQKDFRFVTVTQNQMVSRGKIFKGSPNQSHFIFEINVGNRRIRHITTLNLLLQRILVDLEIHHSISASLFVGSDSFRHWFQK